MVTGKKYGFATAACRIVLGAVFVFSGIVKSIDPWGTAIKVDEYLEAFGMEALQSLSGAIAIGQCVLELVLGLMLLFKVCMRAAGVVTMALMSFFTLLALVIAIWNPIDDCGCFGAALEIRNWATFAKNVVLLPVSILVWRYWRGKQDAACVVTGCIWTAVFAVVALGINLWSWFCLPPIDGFPYRKGTNLRTEIMCTACMHRSVVLVYEDMQTGDIREFSLSDTTWYDTSRWRYVDTRSIYDYLPEDAAKYDFALWRDGLNCADELLFADGRTYMLLMRDADRLSEHALQNITEFAEHAADSGERIMLVAGTDGEGVSVPDMELNGRVFPVYGMDRRLMALILRADAGVVEIMDGVVADKRPWRSMDDLL